MTQRHNKVKDALGDVAALIYNYVVREPMVRESDMNEYLPALVADLGIRGAWQPQAQTLFDVRVMDTDDQSKMFLL